MGRSVAKLLASKGANILIVARNVTNLKDTVESLKVVLTIQASKP